MKISQAGIDLIKKSEGCVLHAYEDAVGVLTIGYGHTGNVRAGQTITNDQAEEILRSDLKRFEDGVNKYVKVDISQGQFDSLVSFSFNLGLGALKSSDLLTYLNKKDFDRAAKEFPLWVHAGGKVLPGLVKRRNAEKELFIKTVKKADPKETVKKVETPKTYKIRSGDTFWGVEERHKYDHGVLQKLNPHVNPDKLKVGQAIFVPGSK